MRAQCKDSPLGPREGRGETAHCDFVPFCLGTLENAGVTLQFRPLLGPREGKGEAANSDFVPICLGTPKNARVTLYGFALWPPGHQLMFEFGIGMDLLVPEVVSLISRLGSMMVFIIHVIVPFIGRKSGTLTAR